jgi:hypothetical protein
MLLTLQQLLSGQQSPWILLLIILLVLALDGSLAMIAIALGVLFVAFKAGKAVYDAVDKLIEWLIFTILRLAEDVLESPPLDKVLFFQLVLVGVKKAYDVINGAQKLIELAVNLAATALAAVLILSCALALALVNLAALGTIVYYLK